MEETTLSGRLPKKNKLKRFRWIKGNQIIELTCFLLMLSFFYDGVYKIAYLNGWGFWISHAPLLTKIGVILKYAIPLFDFGLTFAILKPSFRPLALYVIIISQLISIFWVVSVYLFTPYLFWPYHAFWSSSSTWMQKMGYSLLLAWLAFIVILLLRKQLSDDKKTLLRNKPANIN